MSRQNEKGTRFETAVARYLGEVLGREVERRAKTGAKDRGDLSGLKLGGERVVIECKNRRRTEMAAWLAEAEAERVNDGAGYAFVVHKRTGCGEASMGRQYVTCDLETLAAVIAGGRERLEGE